jgi:hypothetical protein
MTQIEYDNFLKLVTAAAVAATPVIANLPDDVKMSADAEQTSPEMEAQTLAEFRVIRRFAYLIAGTMGNDTYWPKLPALTGGAAGAAGGGLSVDSLKAMLPTLLKDTATIDMVKKAVMGG